MVIFYKNIYIFFIHRTIKELNKNTDVELLILIIYYVYLIGNYFFDATAIIIIDNSVIADIN